MTLLLKNVLFTLVVPGTVGVLVPLTIARDLTRVHGPLFVFALVFLLIGTAIYVRCVWDFASFGRGTPAPIDAPKRLVITGLYRHMRNPMYTGVLTVLIGWTVMFADARLLLYAVFVATGFHLFIVLYEEPHLERVFGDEYREYRAKTGRWLPKIPS
jgi:protein-S-isoprenylcysteine O-methyltransferase Ste14